MKLKLKSLKLLAGRPVAILHKNTAKKLSVYAGERVNIKNNSCSIIAIVDIASGILKEDELAASVEILNSLNLKEGRVVDISVAPKPSSISYILEKLQGKELSYEKLFTIVKDIVNNADEKTEKVKTY